MKQRTALTLRRAKGPAASDAHYPCLQRQSGKDLPQDLREQASSSSSAPRGRAKAVEPSEPIHFGGRSKDRRDYSPRLVTSLDQIHDQGIELFLAGATERPYCSLEVLLRDAKRSSSMDDDDEGGGPAQGAPGETFYSFGSWICYFCEQVNGPALTRMGESVRAPRILAGLTAHRPCHHPSGCGCGCSPRSTAGR